MTWRAFHRRPQLTASPAGSSLGRQIRKGDPADRGDLGRLKLLLAGMASSHLKLGGFLQFLLLKMIVVSASCLDIKTV